MWDADYEPLMILQNKQLASLTTEVRTKDTVCAISPNLAQDVVDIEVDEMGRC